MADKMYAGVKALIRDESGRLLTVQVPVGEEIFYSLPGGRLEYGEEPEDALRRKVMAETSLNITPEIPLGMYHFYIGPESDGEEVVLTVWEVEWNGNVSTDTKHAEDDGIKNFEWVEPTEFGELKAEESLKEFVQTKVCD